MTTVKRKRKRKNVKIEPNRNNSHYKGQIITKSFSACVCIRVCLWISEKSRSFSTTYSHREIEAKHTHKQNNEATFFHTMGWYGLAWHSMAWDGYTIINVFT